MSLNLVKGRNKKVLLTVLFLSLSLGFIYLLVQGMNNSHKPNLSSPLIGQKAPDFLVQPISKEENSLWSMKDFSNQIVIINFWASWCSSCRAESAVLQNFHKKYESKGVSILGIATQDELEDASFVAKKLGKSYKIALDVKGDTALNYGVSGIPETFFINRQGVVVYKHIGPLSSEDIERYVSNIIEENSKKRGASHVSTR